MPLLYSNCRRTAAGKVENPCVWYKKNGNPANFKYAVRNDLDASFRDRWIGRRSVAWTPQSPVLAPFTSTFGVTSSVRFMGPLWKQKRFW